MWNDIIYKVLDLNFLQVLAAKYTIIIIIIVAYNYFTEEIQMNNSLAEEAFLQIPVTTLCEDTESTALSVATVEVVCMIKNHFALDCSVVISTSIFSNITELLQEGIDNFTNRYCNDKNEVRGHQSSCIQCFIYSQH